MDRAAWTKKLVRMVHNIEAGQLPAQVRELYVFGSFARGALVPNDLDLVVIHDDPPQAMMDQLKAEAQRTARTYFEELCGPERRFQARMRGCFRKPGECMDILLGKSLEEVLRLHSRIKREDLVLLWSANDRDWLPKLTAVRPNAAAGAAARKQFISPKRAQCDAEQVEKITDMLENRELHLERILISNIDPRLKPGLQQWYVHWCACGLLGKKAQEVAPFALSWLQSHGVKDVKPGGPCEFYDRTRHYRVQIGRLHLYEMVWSFRRFKSLKSQCLVPHIKRGQVNELLVFRRGPRWAKAEKKHGLVRGNLSAQTCG